MAKSAGERALRKEEKRLQKEKNRRIEEANKMLIPVSKKTNATLGLISFDKDGVFRLAKNRWMKVFEASCGSLSQVAKLCRNLSGRARITMHIDSSGRETCHISLMETGDIYEEVRQMYKKDEAVLMEVISMQQLNVDDVMNEVVANFYKDLRFSYASYVRGNKDWKKECFGEITEKKGSFKMGHFYGDSFVTLAFPEEMKQDIVSSLKSMGCECYLALDLNALSEEEGENFLRAMEKKYNRRLSGRNGFSHINLSLSLSILCDSDDARAIVEKTLLSVMASANLLMTPAFGNQKTMFEGMAGLGLVDAKNMRNVSYKLAEELLGGESDADA